MFGIKFLDFELTIDNIYSKVSSYEILRYYCGNFINGKKFCSPIRRDKTPSFAILMYGDVWLWKDFATGESGNDITLVMKKFGCDYRGALNRINIDFNLGLNSSSYKAIDKTPYIPQIKEKVKADIKIKSREFTDKDLEYWNSFNISIESLKKYNVKSISHYWINGNIYFAGSYLAFAYEFPDGYKLYFPEKTDYKWFSNSIFIQGLSQLNKARDLLIITKSLKDVLVLNELNISAIAPQAESIIISSYHIQKAKERFKTIYTLFDYDNAGIHLAWQMRKLYGIQPIFLTEGIWKRKQGYKGCKDISDYSKKFGIKELKKLINGKSKK